MKLHCNECCQNPDAISFFLHGLAINIVKMIIFFLIWKSYSIVTKEHFYHVGAKENNRNMIYEVLLYNIQMSNTDFKERYNENKRSAIL